MNKTLIVAVLAATTLSSTLAAAQPYQGGGRQGGRGTVATQGRGDCYPGEPARDCRERLRVQQRSNRQYVYRDGRYEARDSTGAAVGAGILGFILGAAIAGSSHDRDYYSSHRNDRNWRGRCQRTYRSFDWRTGTYLGRDGYRHYCTR